ncbi:MAG TPA: DUF6325 family protein [Candidatus Limnocylindrales bacterium]|jgi:hypothetical protein
MSIGPVDLVVLKYTGDRFTGIPAAQIQSLADAGFIRLIDVLFARKGADGEVSVLELDEVEDEVTGQLQPVVSNLTELLNHEDLIALTSDWENRTTAVAILFENVWAGIIRDAVHEAGGEVVLAERIPRSVIEELERSQEGELISQ